jgi:phage tail sheath protein FI
MAANFLHGVETIEIESGSRTIQVVKSAVIGLIGIAPTGDANTLVLVNNDRDAAQFGNKLPGFTIPQSLDAIFKQGAGTVIVVNIFNPALHTAQVNEEALVVTNGKAKLSAAPIGNVTINDSNGDPITYIAGTDYTLDSYGNFVVTSSAIADGTALKFTYKKLDASAVTPAALIGDVDALTGARTGMKCWDLTYNLYGFKPKILIAPGYSSLNAVSAELISVATKLRAVSYLDAPYGVTVSQAISGRGVAGTINFSTSSKRAELLYPHLKWYDAATDSNADFPYSAFKAGIRAAVDNNEGFWVSDSNHEILGIVGAERDISAGISDADSDANLLNEVGITTIFNSFGTGIRTWGNRNASFPTSTAPDNFVCVRRTADILLESVEQATLQFIDKPINNALIDAIKESVNSFIRTLIGRGALIDGKCTFDRSKNSNEEIAAGHLVFDISFMAPPAGERITFNSFIDINLLKALK